MAYKKKTTAKKIEPVKAPEVPKTVKKPTVKKTASGKKYVSTKTRMYHPHQDVYLIPGAKGTMLKLDGWLKAQIKRGLVKEV